MDSLCDGGVYCKIGCFEKVNMMCQPSGQDGNEDPVHVGKATGSFMFYSAR